MKTWLSAVLGAVVVVLIACGKPMQPDVITRPGNVSGQMRTDAGIPVNLNDMPDASVEYFDGGACCMVPVAIAAQADETVGYATEFPSGRRVALTLTDGVWRGQMCFWLSEPVTQYYYQLGYPLDDADAGVVDAGEYLVNYVNRSAPNEGVAAVGEVNVFTPGDVMACQSLDAGVHQQIFDAGTVAEQDAGSTADAGSTSDAGDVDAGP